MSAVRLFLALLVSAAASSGAAADPLAPRVIHVVVALADSASQGIGPVPKPLGDGEAPDTNLYWGAGYGVRTWYRKSKAWKALGTVKSPEPAILERVAFKRLETNASAAPVYLVADAYRGKEIKTAVEVVLGAAAGLGGKKATFGAGKDAVTLPLLGEATLVAYIGHNALMELDVAQPKPLKGRPTIVLACKSREYFQERLTKLGATPLLLTNDLMAPEAYSLDAALEAWLAGKGAAEVAKAAGTAYAKYQKIDVKAGIRMFAAP